MNFRSFLPACVIFFVASFSLFALDYQNEQGGGGEGFLSSLVQSVFSGSSVTEELLAKTSLQGKGLTKNESSGRFFPLLLTLPSGVRASHLHIEDTSIEISEAKQGLASDLMETLLKTKQEGFIFNRINPGAFYLNQVPIETKTDNFLGIVIKNTLYGFQYKPFEHSKVLEVVDALSQTK